MFIVGETSLENIFSHIDDIKPEILVVDSIQTIASDWYARLVDSLDVVDGARHGLFSAAA